MDNLTHYASNCSDKGLMLKSFDSALKLYTVTNLHYQVGKSEEQFPKDTVGCLSVDCQPTVGRQWSDNGPTMG